jgi:hypothetical protein
MVFRAGAMKIDHMSFYREQVLPRFQNKVMAPKPHRAVRARSAKNLRESSSRLASERG